MVLIWRTCQREKLVLITANRNALGPDSLEVVILARESARLPAGDHHRESTAATWIASYGEHVAIRLLQDLISIDDFRGAGRIYVP